jgi:D-alanyl-D-alanine-carboxypeptidase/D-alanyl-D-alanine-endopeptidase
VESEVTNLVDSLLSAGAVGVVVGCCAWEESSIDWGSRLGDEDLTEKVFEAGSITKTFVAMLLVQLASEGVVSLNDKLSELLPESPPDVQAISLVELATHTSGLPRLPPNLRAGNFDRSNPYAHFDERKMSEALRQTEVGEKTFLYSNFGFGLLGTVLSRAAQEPLDVLLGKRILSPLGLNNSQLAIGAVRTENDAVGHDASGNETSHWDFAPQMAGCGAMRMTITDLLTYARYMAESEDGQVATLVDRRAERDGGRGTGLAWIISGDEVWHTGGTGGFGAFAGFNRQKKRAVAVLANSSHGVWRSADSVLLKWLAEGL